MQPALAREVGLRYLKVIDEICTSIYLAFKVNISEKLTEVNVYSKCCVCRYGTVTVCYFLMQQDRERLA
jgi:hypothetical protein